MSDPMRARAIASFAEIASAEWRPPRSFVCLRDDDDEAKVRLTLSGELDVATTPELDLALRGAQHSSRSVTLDLSRLTFMDCSSLSVLVEAADRARASDDRFDVVRGTPHLDRLFALTDINGRL